MRFFCLVLIALACLAAPVSAAPPPPNVTNDARPCQCECGPNCGCTDGRCPDCKISSPTKRMPYADAGYWSKTCCGWVWIATPPVVIATPPVVGIDLGFWGHVGRQAHRHH